MNLEELFEALGAQNEDQLLVSKLKNVLPVLKKSGKEINATNIAQTIGISPGRAKHLIQMGISQKNLSSSDFAEEAMDPLYAILNDYYAARTVMNHNSNAKPNKKMPAIKGTIPNIAQRTGLSEDEISDIVENRWSELQQLAKQHFQFDLTRGYFSKGNELAPKVYQGKGGGEQFDKAIVGAIKELTDDFNSSHYGTLTADIISRQLGRPELARQVDKAFEQNHMRKFDPYRVRGSSPRS